MTIDKEQLISLLEEKTGLDREQVEGQLSQLINRIHEAADEGKTFEIEGFGTFSMTDEGLEFSPADKLETEINNKYAGMKPIELIGAFKEPESDEEVPDIDLHESKGDDIDADDKWALDTEAMGDGAQPDADDEVPKPQELPPVMSEAEDTEEAATEEKEAVDTGDSSEEAEQEPVKEEAYFADEKVQEESDDLLGTILVAAVVVLAVGVGGWLIYDLGFSDQGIATSSTATEQSTTRPDASDNNIEEPELSSASEQTNSDDSEPEQQTQVPIGDESEESSKSEQEQYGLLGELNGDISSGYTIVVHSLRDRSIAEQNRQQLQDGGYRALISRAEIQGVTYYRVGIGQFETVSDAKQALSDIPGRFQDNNFIKRIQ